MEIFLGWLVFSILAGIIGHSKGRSGFGFFLVSVILTPLIGLIAAIAMPAIGEPRAAGGLRPDDARVKCPLCAELVLPEAKVCKHCGRDIEPQRRPPAPPSVADGAP